jgi:hypothetical protein
MAINLNALVFPVSLQENLVDSLGNALAGGTVTFYSNTNRTFLKNVYFQSGNIPPYSYLPLPNPLTLNASGTISDISGNDVLPGFYSLSETDNITVETYYITIQDSSGKLINTLYNFPIVAQGSTPPSDQISTYENLIMNGKFWRNAGGTSSSPISINTYSYVVAPDQHDGYSTALSGPPNSGQSLGFMSDISFNKNSLGNPDTFYFGVFPPAASNAFTNDIAPEYYLRHQCLSSGSGSETLKYYQIPISAHLDTLNNVPITVTIQAIDNLNSGATALNLSLYAFQGTGQTSEVPIPFKSQIVLSGSWNQYSYPTSTPSTLGNTAPNGPGDDALYLWIGLPTNQVCDISIALPSVYIGNQAPSTSFYNYDQINSIISSPRTGDVRTSLNNFNSYGWVPMNDGTIGNGSSGATNRANNDVWQLYNLIWNSVSNTYAPISPNPTRGASALSDFNANQKLSLTKALGQVFAGTATGSVNLGTTSGALTQILTQVNLPAHSHSATIAGTTTSGGAGKSTVISNVGGAPLTTTIAIGNGPGASEPFSIMQPTTYMNVFIKL